MTMALGFGTVERYEIRAILGMKLVAGEIVRNEGKVTYRLGTPHGVSAWVKEQQPFVSLSIIDLSTKEDIATEFTEGIEFCESRYQGGVTYMRMREI